LSATAPVAVRHTSLSSIANPSEGLNAGSIPTGTAISGPPKAGAGS